MSEGGYGATVVWDADEPSKVGGIVTDGDLRRCMANGSLEDFKQADWRRVLPRCSRHTPWRPPRPNGCRPKASVRSS